MKHYINEEKSIRLYNGDCLEVMDKLIEKGVKVQMVMTSPPYFNLRDYEVRGQLGNESTVDSYISNLGDIMDRCKGILNEDGVCFVNISDTYGKDGGLLCVPDRLKVEMIRRGWICRNEIIWHKPNAMPSSAKNRFNQDYEKIYLFVKSKYYYKHNPQYEERKTKSSPSRSKGAGKYRDSEHERLHRQGMDKNRGLNVVEKRKLPPQEEFVETLRANFTKKQVVEKTGLKETTVAHWFRKDKCGFSFPKKEEWAMLETELCPYLLDVFYETDDINKNQDKGRLKRAVWSINTKPSKEKHFATYPQELCETPILFGSCEEDVVLDPFLGSGTTGIVSRKLGRRFIGIELNEQYFDIAVERVVDTKKIEVAE